MPQNINSIISLITTSYTSEITSLAVLTYNSIALLTINLELYVSSIAIVVVLDVNPTSLETKENKKQPTQRPSIEVLYVNGI